MLLVGSVAAGAVLAIVLAVFFGLYLLRQERKLVSVDKKKGTLTVRYYDCVFIKKTRVCIESKASKRRREELARIGFDTSSREWLYEDTMEDVGFFLGTKLTTWYEEAPDEESK